MLRSESLSLTDSPILRDLESLASPTMGSESVAKIRNEALAALRNQGLPTKKTEAWRFTPVRSLVSTPFSVPGHAESETVAWRAPAESRWRDESTDCVHVSNGRLAGPSTGRIASLAEVLRNDPNALEGVLGGLALPEHFAALNGAAFQDGVVVRARAGEHHRPIHLEHLFAATDKATAVHSRLTVVVEEGAELTLIESYLPASTPDETAPGGPLLANVVGEIVVGPRARLHHVRFTESAKNGTPLHQLSTVAVRVETGGQYRGQTVTLGGALSRVDLRVRLHGEGSECALDGVYHVDGSDHVDHQTQVEHAAARTSSRQTYRGVADGRGHAVFNGIVLVRPEAPQTSAHQENRNLLLSEEAVVHTKPHLEIDVDDVTCSHGATVGALDEQALFYLRSRGIPETEARNLLILSFAESIVESVAYPPARRFLRERLASRFPGGMDMVGTEGADALG